MTAGTEEAQLVTIESRDSTHIGLWKTGSGPTLLAVHGTAADHTAWDSMVPLLAGDFAVYAMDRRGRGASGDSSEYSLEREFDDVATVVDSLPGPVHLYGHSTGGTCAVEAALRTRNLGRLMIYEGGAKPAGLRLTPDDFITELEQLLASGRVDEALNTFMLKAAGVTPEELTVLQRHPSWARRIEAAHTIPRELRALNEYASDMAKITTIAAPTLLIVGSETEPRRREMFEGLTRLLSNSSVSVLPGQRHAAHQTAPDLLARTLAEFLVG